MKLPISIFFLRYCTVIARTRIGHPYMKENPLNILSDTVGWLAFFKTNQCYSIN